MKHLLLLFLLGLLYLTPAYTQGNYKAGYVVNLSGDTLTGFIDYRDWNKNPQQIFFKKDLNARTPDSYSVKNASAFAVNGYELYRKYTVSVSQNLDEQIDLAERVDSTYTIDTVFLRLLIKGKYVSLYQYEDALKQRFYIADKNQVPYELIYRRYFDPTLHILGDRIYLGQLKRLASIYQPQNMALQTEITTIPYYSNELKKIATEINGNLIDNEFNKLDIGTRPLFFIGVSLTSTTEQVKGNNEFATAGASTSIFPQINLGLDLIFNKNVGTSLVRAELGLSGNKTSLSTSVSPYSTTGTDYLKFNQYTASLSVQYLYNFINTVTTKFYLGAGATINYSAYTNEQTYGMASGSKYTIPSVALEPPGFFTPKASVGLMANKKIDVHLAWIPPSPIDSNPQYYIRFTSYQFGVNYRFDK